VRRGLGAALLAGSVLLSACSSARSDETEAVRPAKVQLEAGDLPDAVHVGVMVTLNSAPGEGAEWVHSAAGAQVAAYQFHMGGQQVVLDVVDDKGTARGASAAVEKLVADGVSGIAVATSGSHLRGAFDLAEKKGVALLLPYATDDADLPGNAWLTGPSAAQLGAAVQGFLAEEDLRSPFVVTTKGAGLSGIDAAEELAVGPTVEPASVVRAVRRALERPVPVDVVVLDVPAQTQGRLVRALQGASLDVPLVLGREAVSPAFGDSLDEAGGSLAAQLTTVGVDAGDVSSMGAGAAADQAASFFSALRIATDDPNATDLFGQGRFSSQAGSADIASHDAVVAIVAAVAEADSTSRADVLAALDGLRVDGADGLAGPDLDFGDHTAVADADVRPMHSTSQNPGVRPATAGAPQRLFWFDVPAAG
jgi:ABC-type branched-subunit amino acid transport system substrate-binding protein